MTDTTTTPETVSYTRHPLPDSIFSLSGPAWSCNIAPPLGASPLANDPHKLVFYHSQCFLYIPRDLDAYVAFLGYKFIPFYAYVPDDAAVYSGVFDLASGLPWPFRVHRLAQNRWTHVHPTIRTLLGTEGSDEWQNRFRVDLRLLDLFRREYTNHASLGYVVYEALRQHAATPSELTSLVMSRVSTGRALYFELLRSRVHRPLNVSNLGPTAHFFRSYTWFSILKDALIQFNLRIPDSSDV